MKREERMRLLAALEAWDGVPEKGLPLELFALVSELMPLVNVDLLIRDEHLGTLLTWRNDEDYGPGWHIPGGIVRYKETFDSRIRVTARAELGTDVEFDPEPIAMEEAIEPARRRRGHFVSLLYRCRLLAPPAESLRQAQPEPHHGQWAWHRAFPANVIPEHARYRRFF
jgi:ADP-ribose pyrophosphatase YjhB (NUDIX family)